jgi:branched chain amino acid efflux pump
VGISSGTLIAIALMALATYATRAGGLWLASRLDLSERAGAWLDQIPGAILVSLVAPVVLTGGFAEALAAVAVVLVAVKTGSLPAAMVTGVVAVVALRALGSSLLF